MSQKKIKRKKSKDSKEPRRRTTCNTPGLTRGPHGFMPTKSKVEPKE